MKKTLRVVFNIALLVICLVVVFYGFDRVVWAAILGALGLLLLFPYWFLPVFVWTNHRMRTPEWDVLAVDGFDTLPAVVRPFFQETDRVLVDAGFSLAAVLEEQQTTPGYIVVHALYMNRLEKTRASTQAYIPIDSQKTPRFKPLVSFATRFEDGRSVGTSNISNAIAYPDVPGRDSRHFPEVKDPRLLYKIHLLRINPLGSLRREFPPIGLEVAFLAKVFPEYYQSQVGTGYLKVEEPERVYRPTLKGAFLLTWSVLPPLKWILQWRTERKNRAFLAEHQLLAKHL